MTVKVYNSSNCLIWEGEEEQFENFKKIGILYPGDRVAYC